MPGALRIVALIALLLGAVALGACGGNDDREAKNTYVRELNAAQQEFAANASKVSDNGRSGSVGQYRLTVERFEKTIERFASKLRAIQVPSAVKAEHEQLIAALTRFGTDFQKAAGVLKNPSAGAVSQAKSDLTSATQRANARIEAAAAAIDSKLKHT